MTLFRSDSTCCVNPYPVRLDSYLIARALMESSLCTRCVHIAHPSEPSMQSNLFSSLSATRAIKTQAETKLNKRTLVELDASVLKHVAGGLLPNGTWASSRAPSITSLPNGSW